MSDIQYIPSFSFEMLIDYTLHGNAIPLLASDARNTMPYVENSRVQ